MLTLVTLIVSILATTTKAADDTVVVPATNSESRILLAREYCLIKSYS